MSATLQIRFDVEADAISVSFRDVEDGGIRDSRELDESRYIDVDHDDHIVGVEFLNVGHGIDLTGVPHAEDIHHAIDRLLGTHVISRSAA